MAGMLATHRHAPPTYQRVVAVAEKRSRACGCVCSCLQELFSLVGRSGRDDSTGGVAGQKQHHRKSSLAAEVI